MRPFRAALLCAPLIAAGSLAGHALAYRLAYPDEHTREFAYEHSGHAYLKLAPYVFALCLALVLAAVFARALRAAAGRARGRVLLWPFIVLPLLLFTVQEHAERFVSTGSFPVGAMLEKTCVVGLALQLPLGLMAYAVARALVRLSDELGQILAARPRVQFTRSAPLVRAAPTLVELPRIPVLALHRAGRAPPALSVVAS